MNNETPLQIAQVRISLEFSNELMKKVIRRKKEKAQLRTKKKGQPKSQRT